MTKLENVDEPRQNWDDSRLPNLLLNCTNGTHKLGALGKWKDRPHQTKFVTGYYTSTVTIEKKSSKPTFTGGTTVFCFCRFRYFQGIRELIQDLKRVTFIYLYPKGF